MTRQNGKPTTSKVAEKKLRNKQAQTRHREKRKNAERENEKLKKRIAQLEDQLKAISDGGLCSCQHFQPTSTVPSPDLTNNFSNYPLVPSIASTPLLSRASSGFDSDYYMPNRAENGGTPEAMFSSTTFMEHDRPWAEQEPSQQYHPQSLYDNPNSSHQLLSFNSPEIWPWSADGSA